MAPQTQKQWTVGRSGFDGLKLDNSASIPRCGDNDVLVRFHGASLNYRDLLIAKVGLHFPAQSIQVMKPGHLKNLKRANSDKGKYSFAQRDGVVPASDGAGVIEEVGAKVQLFKKGDKVITLFNQGHLAGALDPLSKGQGVGGTVDGALRQYGVFDQYGVAPMPTNLTFLEAASLCCAGLTAWNALYGLDGKRLMPGDWVLTQGTGGVSIFGVQFAKAAGARVIATTSSAEKAKKLTAMGADHVINYREDANWGETAKKLTGGRGVQHIIEVGGPSTMKQSLKAIALEGVITVIGFIGGHGKDAPSMLDALTYSCIVRGIIVGPRSQLCDMIKAIEANDIHPVVDEKVFTLDQARDAYEYMWAQNHFGKLCIKID